MKEEKHTLAKWFLFLLFGAVIGNVLINIVLYPDYYKFHLYTRIIVILALAYICYIMIRISRRLREVKESLKEGLERWEEGLERWEEGLERWERRP